MIPVEVDSFGYSQAKGRSLPIREKVEVDRAPLKELSDEEKEEIAQNRAFVQMYLPKAAADLRIFFEDGLLEGWRAVKNCRLLSEEES